MGALFRIKIIQSFLALSIIDFAGFSLTREVTATPFQPEQLLSSWPLITLTAVGVLYLIFRKTLILPLALLSLSVFALWAYPARNQLSFMWIGLLLVLLAYPVFFYKYLDFTQMLSMLRTVVWGMIAAGGYLFIQKHANEEIATGMYIAVGTVVVGNFMLLLNRKKSLGTGLLTAGWIVLCYLSYTFNDWVSLACLCHFPVLWLCLHHDTTNYEPASYGFVRNPYFRLVSLVLVIALFVAEKATAVTDYLLAFN